MAQLPKLNNVEMPLTKIEQLIFSNDKDRIDLIGKWFLQPRIRSLYITWIEANPTLYSLDSFDNLCNAIREKCKEDSVDVVNVESNDNEAYYINYRYDKFSCNLPSWETLNTNGQPFVQFFRDFVLPNFHPLPNQDIQHPVLLAAMLINTATLPPRSAKNSLEVGVPLNVLVGVSRSGKTQIANRVMMFYPDARTTTIKPSSTGFNMTRAMHEICYHSGEGKNVRFYPSMCLFDNIYFTTGENDFIKRSKDHYTSIISVERADSVVRISQDTYYTFTSKWFTTIEQPLRTMPMVDEFINRALFFYTKKDDATTKPEDSTLPKLPTNQYDWSTVKDAYFDLWSEDFVYDSFYPVLKDVMSLRDNKTAIPTSNMYASRLVLAIGVATGIWDSLDEAINHMATYWEYVASKMDKGGDIIFQVVSDYVEKNWYYPISKYMKFKQLSLEEAEIVVGCIPLTDLMTEVERGSNGIYKATSAKVYDIVVQMMLQHEFVVKQVDKQPVFVKNRMK